MSDDVIGANNEMNATKQDLIAALVQKELKFASKLAGRATDVSRFAVKGAKTVSFPRLGSFTITNRAAGTPEDAAAISSSADQLDLSFVAHVNYIVDPAEAIESVLDWELACAERAATAHGRYVDEQLLGVLETNGQALTGSVTGAISKANFLAMRKTVLQNDGDLSNMLFVGSVNDESILLGIPEFVDADKYGSSNIPNGVIGRLYGVDVMIHNGITDANKYYMLDRSALYIAFQVMPEIGEAPDVRFGPKAKRVAVEQKFGVKAGQLGEKSLGSTISALIVKDGN
jgi:hypothetical protein